MTYQLHVGDALTVLRTLPVGSVQTCITSPPYFGLRAYLDRDHPDKALEIGTEDTPELYVARLVEVFREVRRVLRDDGTLWLNLGDSYAARLRQAGDEHAGRLSKSERGVITDASRPLAPGYKEKDLYGIPWMVAFALRADGWWLRSAITWCKGNPMPESVTDRPTSATEQVFLLAKSQTYYYDAEAIREEASPASIARISQPNFANQKGGPKDYRNGVNSSRSMRNTLENFAKNPGRNRRNWWLVNTEPYPGSHYATFPPKLIEPCILAGSSSHGCCAACGAPWARVTEPDERVQAHWNGTTQDKALAAKGKHGATSVIATSVIATGSYQTYKTTGWQPTCTCAAEVVPCTVLDPFFGSGTTAAVALKHGRNFIGIDLDADNLALAHTRIEQSQPLLLGAT